MFVMDKHQWLMYLIQGKFSKCIVELMSTEYDAFCLGSARRDMNMILCKYLQGSIMDFHEGKAPVEHFVDLNENARYFQESLQQLANNMNRVDRVPVKRGEMHGYCRSKSPNGEQLIQKLEEKCKVVGTGINTEIHYVKLHLFLYVLSEVGVRMGLLPSLQWLQLELTACYNHMYVAMATAPSSAASVQPSISVTSRPDGKSWLSSCLNRALRALKVKDQGHRATSTLEKMESLLKFAELLQGFGCLVPLVLCGCLESLALMQTGHIADAQRCLQLMKSCSSSLMQVCPPLIKGLLPALASECIPNHQTPSVSDLLSLLQGLCCFRCYDNSAARQQLEEVCFQPWKPACCFLQASLLLEAGSEQEAACLLENLLYGGKSTVGEGALRARLLHLLAKCYIKMTCFQRSALVLHSALQADSAFSVPLCTLSKVYRLQQQDGAELESLNLLVSILEDQEKRGVAKSSPIVNEVFLEAVTFGAISSEDHISLLHAQYALAKRCHELGRYREASEQYVGILATLTGAVTLEVEKCSHVSLPPTGAIFVECGASLLASEEFQDCVAVCERALEVFTDHSPLDLSPSPSPSPPSSPMEGSSWLTQATLGVSPSMRSRKRQAGDLTSLSMEDRDEDADDWTVLERHASLLICKAQALKRLDRRKEAKQDVQKAMERLQQFGDRCTATSLRTQPAVKKPKMDADSCAPSEAPVWQQMLSQACGILADLLSAESNHQEALRFHQMAVQYNPASTEAWYGCCLTLQDCGRKQEAARVWLQHRGIDVLVPTDQLLTALRQRLAACCQTESSLSSVATTYTEETALKMDFGSLEFLHPSHRPPH